MISQLYGVHAAYQYQQDKMIKWKLGRVNEKQPLSSTSLNVKS